MTRIVHWASIILFVLAAVSLVMGATFIAQGVTKTSELKAMAQREKVNLGTEKGETAKGEIVDSLPELLASGNILREHRQNIAQTYGDLLAGGHFDPTNPKHLTYAQAINLETTCILVLSASVSPR